MNSEKNLEVNNFCPSSDSTFYEQEMHVSNIIE